MGQVFSDVAIEHAINPRNWGKPAEWNGWARYKGPCGDTMEIWLNLCGDKVESANFWTDGCASAIACGSAATELVKWRSLREVAQMGQDEVLNALQDPR